MNLRDNVQAYMSDLRAWLKSQEDAPLEAMSDFFTARLDGYEEHMAHWCEDYRRFASLFPENARDVLDLGCGWGPVGVSLGAANPEAQLVLCDVNERAVALAQKNIRSNGLTNAQAVVSDAFSALSGSFDHVVTNPPIRAGKQAIYAMFDEAHERLTPGGTLTIVIRKQQGAPSAQKHLLSVFGNAETIARGGGYHVIQCRKEEHHD